MRDLVDVDGGVPSIPGSRIGSPALASPTGLGPQTLLEVVDLLECFKKGGYLYFGSHAFNVNYDSIF